MRHRLTHLLMILLLLLGLVPTGAAPALAADDAAEAESPAISAVELLLPETAKAGEDVRIRVLADASGEGGLCCGSLTLRGPEGQDAYVELSHAGADELRATWALDPRAAPGRWVVTSLKVWAVSGRAVQLTRETGLQAVVTVKASGRAPDRSRPKLVALSVPAEAQWGTAYPITVKAKDVGSGVASVIVKVEPDPRYGKSWKEYIPLYPSGERDTYTGMMLMEPSGGRTSPLRVTEVWVQDRAGNFLRLKDKDLAAFETETVPVMTEAPEGLMTTPFLDLIHPGKLTFRNWLTADRQYLQELLLQTATDPVAVRERMMAELPLLRAALDGLRDEIYTDPESGLRAVPYFTTGKWMVLDRAVDLRTYVLTVAGLPRAERTKKALQESAEWLAESYDVLRPGDRWAPDDEASVEFYARQAGAYLRAIARSPEAVAVLQTQGFRPAVPTVSHELDPNLVYFIPVWTETPFEYEPGYGMVRIPVHGKRSMMSVLSGLFYQIGLHLGETYLSSGTESDPDAIWQPYMELRGLGGWPPEGARETPATNLAVDFVRTFMPDGLGWQFRVLQFVPRLEPGTDEEEAFRTWVRSLLQSPPLPRETDVTGMLQVGLEDLEVEISVPSWQAMLGSVGEAWGSTAQVELADYEVGAQSIRFRGTQAERGKVYIYVLTTSDGGQRFDYRLLAYAQVPALIDPLPAVTTEKEIVVTGTTLPSRLVRMGGVKGRSGPTGRFRLQVPLKKGANELRLTVQGVEPGARLTIYRDTVGAEVPLEVEIEGGKTTREEKVILRGKTVPYAMVTAGHRTWQVGSSGEFTYYYYLYEMGRNTLRVEARDRSGNVAVWEETVVRSQVPLLEIDPVPETIRTQTVVITGRVEDADVLTMNTERIAVGPDGRFSVTVSLEPGQTRHFDFAATNEHGSVRRMVTIRRAED